MVAQAGGVFVGMAANVNAMAAVAVMLSLGHNPSQAVGFVNPGIALGVELGRDAGVGVAGSTVRPQAVKRIRVRPARQKRITPGSLVIIVNPFQINPIRDHQPLTRFEEDSIFYRYAFLCKILGPGRSQVRSIQATSQNGSCVPESGLGNPDWGQSPFDA